MSEYILYQVSSSLYAYRNGKTYWINYTYDKNTGFYENVIIDAVIVNSLLFTDNDYCLLKIDMNLLIEQDKMFYIDYTNKLIYDKLLNEGEPSANG